MTRIHFESPLCLDPLDDCVGGERSHIALLPGNALPWKAMILGGIIILCTFLGVMVQRNIQREPVTARLDRAMLHAERNNRALLLLFTDSSAVAATQLDAETFSDDEVMRLLESRFEVVRIEQESGLYRDVAPQYDVITSPTIILASARGEPMTNADGSAARHTGFLPPRELAALLRDAMRMESKRPRAMAKNVSAGANQVEAPSDEDDS